SNNSSSGCSSSSSRGVPVKRARNSITSFSASGRRSTRMPTSSMPASSTLSADRSLMMSARSALPPIALTMRTNGKKCFVFSVGLLSTTVTLLQERREPRRAPLCNIDPLHFPRLLLAEAARLVVGGRERHLLHDLIALRHRPLQVAEVDGIFQRDDAGAPIHRPSRPRHGRLVVTVFDVLPASKRRLAILRSNLGRGVEFGEVVGDDLQAIELERRHAL